MNIRTADIYPIYDNENSELYEKYVELSKKENNVIFGGSSRMYKYYDMWQVIDKALKLVKSLVEL
ncbi:MAG: hypothetical protein E7Z81_03310 [Methanobrevibacter sp.]|uniref:UDP-galactopyranose mutase n=1 Tax=Methanobrevibacter sp. TaxID=66852 RepID=UPI0025F3FD4C|nr:UDP-galactopyranose mutase [Methanobrevibacter sp.]MBE6497295.1 hypothetical protein [Methanobrevibacter sp.]